MSGKFDQIKYNNAYNAKAYDRTCVMLKKGIKSLYAAHAAGRGESLNAFITRAMRDAFVRDGGDVDALDAVKPGSDQPGEKN